MNKRILIPTIAAAVCGSTAIAIAGSINIKNANAELNLGSEALVAANNTISNTSQVSSSKDETVYVITDTDGTVRTKFIGNTIYNGTDSLPFDFKISYYLDGAEISAKDLKGKSGHVKIVYKYNSTAQYQGKYVPFMAVTGVTLDANKFKNVKIENGKIISESADNYVIAGYSLTGLDANLGTDFLSDTFVLEADVADFELGNTYTMFMNDIFADLDTSKLSDLDSLTNSMTELSNGLNKIIDGAGSLSTGLSTALDGTKALYAGSQKLSDGAADALEGATNLSDSLNNLDAGLSAALTKGASDIFDGVLDTTSQTLIAQISQLMPGFSIELTQSTYNAKLTYLKSQLPEAYAGTIDAIIEKLDSIASFCGYLNFYTGSVGQMAEKAPELVDGLTLISDGTDELTAGLASLVDGTAQLYNGSVTLKDGLNTLKTTGIDKLVSFATNDLQRFTANLRSTVSAAGSYKHFGDNTTATSVKFILKSPLI